MNTVKQFQITALVALAFGLSTTVASGALISEDFEGATAPAAPAGWTVISNGGGTYATAAGRGGGQGGAFDWTSSNQTTPGIYLVNNGVAFDASQPISGNFDFIIDESTNYSTINFIFGDVLDGAAGAAGEFLNLNIRRKTFGARASLTDGSDAALVSGSNNNWEVGTGAWYDLRFTWTPTSGTTGDVEFIWSSTEDSYGPDPDGEVMTYSGYTFDSNEVWFGFGTGRSDGTFDNINITGELIPEPASIALIGLGGLAMITRRRA